MIDNKYTLLLYSTKQCKQTSPITILTQTNTKFVLYFLNCKEYSQLKKDAVATQCIS